MTSLLTHLLDDGDHGELGFRADCPVCRGTRAAGALPRPGGGGPVRAAAWTLAGALALGGPAATAAGALAQAPGGEQVTQHGTESGGAQTVDPSATPIADGTDDTTGLPSGDDPASGQGDAGPEVPLPAEGPTGGQEGTATPPPDLSDTDPSEGDAAVPDPDPGPAPAPASPAPAPAPSPPAATTEQAAPVAPTAVPTPAPSPPVAPQPLPRPVSPEPATARPAPPQAPRPGQPLPRSGSPEPRAPRDGGRAPVPALPPTVAAPAPPAVAGAPASESGAQTTPGPRPGARVYVVRAGDSLWSIARTLLGERASEAQIARLVDRLWQLNAKRIGTGDPSLIRPGQRLVLPETLRAG
jgi:LysM domain